MDINALLGMEQSALLEARFARGVCRLRHLKIANEAAEHLRASTYPHRRLDRALVV